MPVLFLISSRDTLWLTLSSLITVMKNVQIKPIYEVLGLIICLVRFFWQNCEFNAQCGVSQIANCS